MADPILTLSVPLVPAVAVGTAVIAETQVGITGNLIVPRTDPISSPYSETISSTPYSSVTTMVGVTREFATGILKIAPTVIGRTSKDSNFPKKWFQWGNNIVIEPVPDDQAEYQLCLHVADYPRRDLNSYHNLPDELPKEFHSCIVDFACYVLLLKLKKWKQAAKFYNIYIRNLKQRQKEYMDRKVDRRKMHAMSDNVTITHAAQGQQNT